MGGHQNICKILTALILSFQYDIMAYLYIENKITSFAKLTDMGGNWEFSSQKMDMDGNGNFLQNKILIWMDMDLVKRGGVEWVSKFCLVVCGIFGRHD